jgi:outer membrane usher protein
VLISSTGDIFLSEPDRKRLGIEVHPFRSVEHNGRIFVSLHSMTGVSTRFDERTVTLDIMIPPSFLPNQVIDLAAASRPDVVVPGRNRSAYLNYGLSYDFGNAPSQSLFNLSNQLGINIADFTFLSESSYSGNSDTGRFVRLQTSLSRDSRSEMTRMLLGDFFASSGSLGSSISMGGISSSRVFRINPYFVRDPAFQFSGLAPFATQADIYVDGMLVRSQKLQPGRFDLQNFSYYGGYRNMEIVLKDVFGREERIQVPFYFSNILLRKGLHEFSYNIGFVREDYGRESNHYTIPAFSAYHRYGVNDHWTVGFRGEGIRDLLNAGLETSITLGSMGVATLAGAYSTARDGGNGLAGLFTYDYHRYWFSARLLLQGSSRNYRSLSSGNTAEVSATYLPRLQAGGGISIALGSFGTLSFDYTRMDRREPPEDTTSKSVNYSVNLWKSSTLLLTLMHEQGKKNPYSFYVTFNFYPWQDHPSSVRASQNGETEMQGVQFGKTVPQGEGYGYRVSLERSRQDHSDSTYRMNPFIQYNGQYGIYSADYRGTLTGTSTFNSSRLTASGALVFIDGSLGATRPIYDSFALVKLGDIKDVTVRSANQPMGKTDSTGRLLLPNLGSYYVNQVAVDAADIPMNYTMPNMVKYVSPWYKGGVVVDFDPLRIQAVTGRLTVAPRGKRSPVEFQDLTTHLDGIALSLPTGRDGEFYIEKMSPGRHTLTFIHEGIRQSCLIDVPAGDEPVTDVGGISCEALP